VWGVEGVTDDGDDVWHVAPTLEPDDDGRIVRDTRYSARPFDPPARRARWVEPIA
jgi:hypothetical protein